MTRVSSAGIKVKLVFNVTIKNLKEFGAWFHVEAVEPEVASKMKHSIKFGWLF